MLFVQNQDKIRPNTSTFIYFENIFWQLGHLHVQNSRFSKHIEEETKIYKCVKTVKNVVVKIKFGTWEDILPRC
jgi:hypothetical protein